MLLCYGKTRLSSLPQKKGPLEEWPRIGRRVLAHPEHFSRLAADSRIVHPAVVVHHPVQLMLTLMKWEIGKAVVQSLR